MANPTLSTTSSIVDYLSLQGKDSSYSARQKLYNEMGLNKTLGEYVGSANQNTNFLNTLRNQNTPISTITPTSTQVNTPATNAVNAAGQTGLSTADYQAVLNAAKQGGLDVTKTSSLSPLLQQTLANVPAGVQYPTATPTTIETPASNALSSLYKMPSAADLSTQVAEDPAFKLYQESLQNKGLADTATAEAKKQQLQVQYEADKTKLEQNLAERGLAFSGIRTQDVQSLTNSLATSTLGVDRELASTLLQSDTNLKGKFLDIASSLIKEASDENDKAIEQMNKLGFAVIDGQLIEIPKDSKDSVQVVNGGLYDLDTNSWLVEPEDKTTDYKPPTSYQEWTLAGSPGTYADYLMSKKPASAAQQTVAQYALRVEQSMPIIDKLETDISTMNPVSFAFQSNQKVPAALQSETMQKFMQAARNFINAKLRQESGAVIADSEFTNAYAQYLPQPGDSIDVLKQKKANRELVFKNLRSAAGNAYQPLSEVMGEETELKTVTTKDGVTWRINADGTYTSIK